MKREKLPVPLIMNPSWTHTGFDDDIGSLVLAHALFHCVLPMEAAPGERSKALYLAYIRFAASMSLLRI